MKIVVVEDEIRIREGIAKLVQKLDKGYEVAGEAENGKEGLELIRRLRPDIIITDIKMPEMDGIEMLQHLHDEGILSKAIVLSAYSEFDYARQAIKLGVTEYLLKPLTLAVFSQALENVRFLVEKEKAKQPQQVGTKEQVFRELLYGNLEAEQEVADYLTNRFKIDAEHPFIILCVYLGYWYQEQIEAARKNIRGILAQKSEIPYCMLESEHYKSLILILHRFIDAHSLERWFQYQMLNNHLQGAVFGWVEADNIRELRPRFHALYPYMDYNIALDEEVLISYPKITHAQTVPCLYPYDLENQAKAAICMYDWENTEHIFMDFHNYFKNGKLYAPAEIKECYVRFLWAAIGMAKELNCLKPEKLKQEKLLEMIMGAKSRRELVFAAKELLSWLERTEDARDTMTNLNIKRAKSMIHEFYQSGITLEEIANKLNLTPEYLGAQFHKEVGVNFSSYIRDCRINKAKELLCGTQLRLYEIAEKVGYANPKYFSQVFKEHTGLLPVEYRKIYK